MDREPLEILIRSPVGLPVRSVNDNLILSFPDARARGSGGHSGENFRDEKYVDVASGETFCYRARNRITR